MKLKKILKKWWNKVYMMSKRIKWTYHQELPNQGFNCIELDDVLSIKSEGNKVEFLSRNTKGSISMTRRKAISLLSEAILYLSEDNS